MVFLSYFLLSLLLAARFCRVLAIRASSCGTLSVSLPPNRFYHQRTRGCAELLTLIYFSKLLHLGGRLHSRACTHTSTHLASFSITAGDCKYTIGGGEEGHTEWVSCVRFSPSAASPLIVSCGWDKNVKVLSLPPSFPPFLPPSPASQPARSTFPAERMRRETAASDY
jgi:hypothetical protein